MIIKAVLLYIWQDLISSYLNGTIVAYDTRRGFDSRRKLYHRIDSADEE